MSVSFDSVAEIYDKTRGPPEQILKLLVKTLNNELHCCQVVLDVGVGTGRFSLPLQENGLEVIGVDIARRMVHKAVAKDVRDLLLGDARALPFRGKTFDTTICIHLLHLIKQWDVALREICRVTRHTMISTFYARPDTVGKEYDRLLEKHGHERRRLGRGEWELKDSVKPLKSVLVASYEVSADERLDYLGQRASSSQWKVSEDVNKMVVDKLRSRFTGKRFRQDLQVLVWSVSDLEAYIRTRPYDC